MGPTVLSASKRRQLEQEALSAASVALNPVFHQPTGAIVTPNGDVTVQVYVHTGAAPHLETVERDVAVQLKVRNLNLQATLSLVVLLLRLLELWLRVPADLR